MRRSELNCSDLLDSKLTFILKFPLYDKEVKEYFFNLKLNKTFKWQGLSYQIGAVLPSYRRDFIEGLHELSVNSIRNRFHGIKKEFSEQELNYLTQFDGINHFAIGIRNECNEGIAVARMVKAAKDSLEAEVAITIIDKYQHKGLGTFLYQCIALAAYERGVEILIIDLLDQNEGMLKLASKVGRIARKIRHLDTLTLYIHLDKTEMENFREDLNRLL